MKVKERVHGRAMAGENDRPRRKIMGMESVPKIKGMIRRSLSGCVNG
jgi:hypothetical protein